MPSPPHTIIYTHGGGRLGTAAGIGAETAAQAGIGAGGEATRQAVQDDKMDIGRNHATEGQLHQVAAHQLGCQYRLPLSITTNGRIQGEARFQRFEGSLCMTLLKVS